MAFEPIAIIGQGCVLPGALDAQSLWTAIVEGRDLTVPVPEGRWPVDLNQVTGTYGRTVRQGDMATPRRGGFVTGFDESFDPDGFRMSAERIGDLDGSVRWLLDSARQAVTDAGYAVSVPLNTAIVIGNHSYPTASLVDLAHRCLVEAPLGLSSRPAISGEADKPCWANRFSSGRPAHLLAEALGADGPAYCLDAACASSLYAMKLACDYLQDGTADLALTGAVCGTENIFLHLGFADINALSPSGISAPFSRQADGLLPAEGAGIVVLKRLSDALRDGDRIHAVIRGIGLSNNGRRSGLLAPSSAGQAQAIRNAYAVSGVDPKTLTLLECHATGTPVGDGTELESIASVFDGVPDLPVGSIKSNMGHALTAAGIGAVLKVTGAMAAGLRPPTLHAQQPLEQLTSGPFRPLHEAEPWPDTAPRRAGINNFGFGGSNAHLILEEFTGDCPVYPVDAPAPEPIALCGIGMVAGKTRGFDAFCQALQHGDADAAGRMEAVEIPFGKLRFQPNDLKQSLGQQTAILAASQLAIDKVGAVDPERSGVVIGMGCDVDAARCCIEIRLAKTAAAAGVPQTAIDEAALTEAIAGLSSPGHVIGAMPNLPANRINVDFDWQAIGYTVSSEELSGFTALEIAIRALRAGDLDVALAGAVDLSHEPVNRLAGEAVLPTHQQRPGDAAIAFVLKRKRDAEASRDPILATIDVTQASRFDADVEPAQVPECTFGHAHAAAAMVRTCEALATHQGRFNPPTDTDGVTVSVDTFTGMRQTTSLTDIAPGPEFGSRPDAPFLFYTAAEDVGGLREALLTGKNASHGAVRIAITASDRSALTRKIDGIVALIDAGEDPAGPGVHYVAESPNGTVAFVYPGSAAAYAGMARGLPAAFPEVGREIRRIYGESVEALLAAAVDGPQTVTQFADRAAATTSMAIFGTHLLRNHIGIAPAAAIGLSIGEANMLAALGVWDDPRSVLDALLEDGFYDDVGCGFRAIAAVRNPAGVNPVVWENHDVFAPVEAVEAVVRDLDDVWILIVTSPGHCMIGGAPESCAAAIARIAPERSVRAREDLAFHGPFAASVGQSFRRIHRRPLTPAPDIGFYYNARHDRIRLDPDAIADCLRDQGINRVDLRPTVLKAWQDGVRTFIDIGPSNGLAAAISATLGDRPHVVASLDRPRRDSLLQLADLAATVFAAGLDVDIAGLVERLDRLRGGTAVEQAKQPPSLVLPAHLPEVDTAVFESMRQAVDRSAANGIAAEQNAEIIPLRPAVAQIGSAADAGAQMQREAEKMVAVQGGASIVSRRGSQTQSRGGGQTAEPDFRPEDAAATVPGHATIRLRAVTPGSADAASKGDANRKDLKPIEVRVPTGPCFSRAQLEVLAGGRISSVFGPLFAQQDGFRRQCRMPEPPLLLADRVVGMEGEPGSMGTGICWTETDIADDAWYLHNGTMPTGLLIEAGQADLLLISWLGTDFLNRDQRVYRLLGCEITFHEGPLPTAGDTLRYQIHIDGHAQLGDTRMFFFRYDARIGDRLVSSVRSGQAGFFSDEELANSSGVLWSAEEEVPAQDSRCDPAPGCCQKRAFSEEDVAAFAAGDAFACFGQGFEMAAAHQRTPSIPSGRMQLIDRVDMFDPAGGPWGRGYLKASFRVPVDAWYYEGHFKNDPCMPGTLMAEAATQALQFHMAALGFTIDRDGWTFRPVTGEAFKFICRGQVIPDREHQVTYEVFVEEIIGGDTPTLYAALLARCDGHKVFLCRRFGVKLVPDWPLYGLPVARTERTPPCIVSPEGDVPGDPWALLACAWGRPSDAFGSMYAAFDGATHVPRLPGPPYHCVSRIVSTDCPPGKATPGGRVVAEFDVDPNAWYFAESGNRTMPFSILSEVLLQPCGWLASYMGFALAGNLKFRNLDGSEGRVSREIGPETGTLTVTAVLEKSVAAGPMTLVFFDITCCCGQDTVFSLKTDFGFFPPDALAAQKGLPMTDVMREALTQPGFVEPMALNAAESASGLPAGLPLRRLAMVDAVTGFWPDGGREKLGRAVGRQVIDPTAWYFKAHFFEDPVQPGSLGLEALFTLLKATAKLMGLHETFDRPHFEAPALGSDLSWKYRGQVVPTNRAVTTEIDIVGIDEEENAIVVTGAGSLWVDDLRIYEVEGFTLRIRESGPMERETVADATAARDTHVGSTNALGRAPASVDLTGWTIDLANEPWLEDHCPTYVIPVYPMMALVADLIDGTDQSRGDKVSALRDVELSSWLRLDGAPLRLSSKVFASSDNGVSRQIFSTVGEETRRVGRAVERLSGGYPPAPEPWPDIVGDGVAVDPYRSGVLFHFETFHLARDLVRSGSASRFALDAADALRRAGGHAGILLDAVLHGIPHNRPAHWFDDCSDMAAFPYRLERLQLYADLPREGELIVLSRAAGQPTERTIRSEVQVLRSDAVIMEIDLIEALVPIGVYECLEPESRRSFARDHEYRRGWAIADTGNGETRLDVATVRQANWLPGTLESVYGIAPGEAEIDPAVLTELIAIKDHFAVRHQVHPAAVRADGNRARLGTDGPDLPFKLTWHEDTVQVRDIDPETGGPS